jgi:hypothetical protein
MSSFISAGGGSGTSGQIPVTIYANLPNPASLGQIYVITDGKASECGDGSCTTWGTAVTGGNGFLPLLVWYNGTYWQLIGYGPAITTGIDSQPLGMP